MLFKDIWKSGVLLPTLVATTAGTVPWVTAVVATMLVGKGPVLPASVSLFSLLALLLMIATFTLSSGKVTAQAVEVAGVIMFVLVLPLDWGFACQRSGTEGWPLALITIMTMTAAGARESVCLSCNVMLGVWLLLRSIEDSFRFGLYSPYDNDASQRCGEMCADGWEVFVVSLGARLVPVMAASALCYGTTTRNRRFQSAVVTIQNSEYLVWELVKMNIDKAESVVECITDETGFEEGLKHSFVALIDAIRLFKSYLPQTVLVEENETVFPADIQIQGNLFDAAESVNQQQAGRPPPLPAVPSAASQNYLVTGDDWQAPDLNSPTPMEPQENEQSGHRQTKVTVESVAISLDTIKPGKLQSSAPELMELSGIGADYPSPPMPMPKEVMDKPAWLSHPGMLRPKFATLLLIEVSMNLADQTAGGTGGLVNVFVKLAIETARAFEGVTLHIEAHRMLVSWNTHKAHPQHAVAACGFALELHAQLQNSSFPAWYSIAIACGTFFVGSAGVKNQMAPVVYGQATPLLQGITALGRQIHTPILLLDKVYTAVRTVVEARPVDSIKTPDSHDTILVYELVGAKHPNFILTRSAQLYVEAFSMLRNMRLLEARAKFTEYLASFRDDYQAARLLRISLWLHGNADKLEELRAHGNYYYREQLSYWDDFESKADLGEEVISQIPSGTPESKSQKDDSSEASETEGIGPRRPSSSSCSSTQSNTLGRKYSFRSSRSVKSGSASTVGRRPTTAADSSTGKLKKQLLDAHREMSLHSPDDDQLLSPTVQDSVLPTNFTDTSQRNWVRSEKRLGKGAFGDVWLGMSSNGGLVAMKVMKIPARPDEERSPASPVAPSLQTKGSMNSQRRRSRRAPSRYSPKNSVKELLQEVAMLENMRHDNVVGYLGSCVAGRTVMIVMEYLSGGSLADVVKEFNELPISSIRRYTRDIVTGLTFLHENGIVHRDLKPHNVLMTNDGDCKLADFGTATLLSEVTATSPTVHGNRGERVSGTPLYMSPEACNAVIDKASDIWSLGILVCQLFSGSVPYDLPTEGEFIGQAFMYKLKTDETMVPRIPDLPEDALEFVKSCLSRNPAERATARQLDSMPFLLT
ncbi:Mitogen-activated protein kinase kinase kinase YODA [Diplonema papillatum]|nr:Mitogen-activated protein kinase kinase kinase YODA [Diplonema papillatum]